MKSKVVRISCALLALMMTVAVFASCAASDNNGAVTGTTGNADSTTAAIDETTQAVVTTYPDVSVKFAETDLGGRVFKIHSSKNIVDGGAGMSSSNKYIQEGESGQTGDEVIDTVYRRNTEICKLLNCEIEYTLTDLTYSKILTNFETLVKANQDFCDLYINDQFFAVRAATSNLLCNLNTIEKSDFDYNAPGWYYDYMADLTIGNQKMYAMAGDYFLDLLRNAHVLMFNKEIFNANFRDYNELYGIVSSGEWTYSELSEYIENSYFDKNGNTTVDDEDTYGLVFPKGSGEYTAEGAFYAFIYASDVRSVTFDDKSMPVTDTDLNRVSELCDTLIKVFGNQGTAKTFTTQTFLGKFTSGGSLFLSYCRFGDLEDSALRKMNNLGVIPYPKLNDKQADYYTVIHDTAELGVIPATCSEPAGVTTLVQAMMQYTNKELLPLYYELALKSKYVRDEPSAQMVDIVRNGITSSFEMMYGFKFGRPLYVAIRDSVSAQRNKVAETYSSLSETMTNGIKELTDVYTKENSGE